MVEAQAAAQSVRLHTQHYHNRANAAGAERERLTVGGVQPVRNGQRREESVGEQRGLKWRAKCVSRAIQRGDKLECVRHTVHRSADFLDLAAGNVLDAA